METPGPSRRKRPRVDDEEENERGRKLIRKSSKGQHSRDPSPKRRRIAKAHKVQGRKVRPKKSKACNEGGNLQSANTPEEPLALSPDSFHFIRVLGEGSFGTVMLASYKKTGQLVAVKIIEKSKLRMNGILMESRLLEKAQGSPFLCHGLAAFQTQEHCFLVMEYLQGDCLFSFLERERSLSVVDARFITAELVSGIQFLHSQGIIHRDLKPENILMDAEGHVKIADFGLVKENIFGDKKTCGFAGTAEYVAPEVYADTDYGASADWWSLGIILYEMLTGQHPFYQTFNLQRYKRQIHTAKLRCPEWLDKDAADILTGLLEKDPNKRLGVNGNIKEHPFFRRIDWDTLESRIWCPPLKPAAGLDHLSDMGPLEYQSFMDDGICLHDRYRIRGLSYVTPELRDRESQRGEANPHQMDCTSDKRENVPEQMDCTSERRENVPEQMDCTSERRENVPEQMDCTSERRENVPEQMDCTSERREALPEWRDYNIERREAHPHWQNYDMEMREVHPQEPGHWITVEEMMYSCCIL